MEVIDLFKDWTPEMLGLLKDMGKYPNKSHLHSKSTKMLLSRLHTGTTLSEETKQRMSSSRAGISQSPSHVRNNSRGQRGKTLSEGTKRLISRTETGKTLSKEHKSKISAALSGIPKSGSHIISNSIAHMGYVTSKETKRKLSESVTISLGNLRVREHLSRMGRERWNNFTQEEKDNYMKNSYLSPESVKKSNESRHISPSMPEKLTRGYLDTISPGKWLYNGDLSQGIRVGLKIPDFVRADGTKEVVEVLGGLGWCHFIDDEESLIKYYKGQGYKCYIVWEWDCYLPGELDKIFKVKEVVYG